MERGIDAVLQRLDGGAYDIKIGFDGDIETEDFFDTAIIVSLLSDRRANESEVLESHMRRGWIGDEHTPGFEIGSKLWLFDQSRLSRSVMTSIEDAAREALQWLVNDDHAIAIRSASLTMTATGVSMEVVIERSLSRVEKKNFDLWQSTAITESASLVHMIVPTIRSLQIDAGTKGLKSATQLIGISTEWTIALWVKRTNLFGADQRDVFTIKSGVTNQIGIAKSGALATDRNLLVQATRDNGLGTKQWDIADAEAVFEDGAWRFIVVTFDGLLSSTDEMDLYVNGEIPGNLTKTLDDETPMADVNRNITIGESGYNPHLGLGLFTTRHNQEMIWTKKLSQDAVRSLYNCGNPRLIDPNRAFGNYADAASLIAWWRPGHDPGNLGKNYAASGVIDLTVLDGVSSIDVVDDFPGL